MKDYKTILQEILEKLEKARITQDDFLLNNAEIEHILSHIDSLRQENKQLKDLIDTILNFSIFKEECPLNLWFENNTNEYKSQSIFYEGEWCDNNCNDNYKDCWLKYFKKLQELEQLNRTEWCEK